MTFLKLLALILLPLLPVANARSLDGETVQELLKDVDEFTDELACQDCKQIIEILEHLLSDKEFQVKLKNTLEILCDELPDAFATSCRRGIDANLPTAVSFLTGLMVRTAQKLVGQRIAAVTPDFCNLNQAPCHLIRKGEIPDRVCTRLGLCESDFRQQVKEILMEHIQKIVAPPTLESSIQCGICTYVLNLLPRAQTESALTVVLSEACSFLPFLIRGQCSQITQKYIRMIFEELLNPESPKSICSLLHLCQSLSTGNSKAFSPLSDCDRSAGLEPCDIKRGHITEVARQLETSADLCVKRERADVGDPCALGPRFACRNMLTAYTCGVVPFCQKNMWK